MILLIDNYDSFSYNLYQLIGSVNSDIKVVRNDEVSIADIESMKPEHIILSPGPGRPADAGICKEAAAYFAGKIPMLGVCLGHQAICEAFGAEISYAKRLMHGKQSVINADKKCRIFENLPEEIPAARYHSLSAVRESMPDTLKITAESDDGEIMAVSHIDYDVYGLQFHPESILTPAGRVMIENFLLI